MRNRLLVLIALVFVPALQSSAASGAVPAPPKVHVQISIVSKTDVLFLESVDYPKGTPLPIPVKVDIPKGAQVAWAGEVFGGEVTKDIAANYKLTPRKDYDEVSFTLNKARSAQVEANWHAVKTKGAESVIAFPWVQRYPAEFVNFGFKSPTLDSVVKMTPPWKDSNIDRDKLRFYVTGPLRLPAGKKLDVKISYTGKGGAGQAGQGASGGLANSAILILVVLIAAAAIGATIFTQVRKVE